MVSDIKVQEYIDKWMKVTKVELRARLKTLQDKSKSADVQSEICAIKTLLL